MWYRPSRRLSVGILAALLALGMSLSAVSAGMLPAEMAISIGAEGARPDCCNDCGDAGHIGMGACVLACLAGAQAVLSCDVAPTTSRSGEIGAIAQLSLSGRTVQPDPDPPQRFLLD